MLPPPEGGNTDAVQQVVREGEVRPFETAVEVSENRADLCRVARRVDRDRGTGARRETSDAENSDNGGATGDDGTDAAGAENERDEAGSARRTRCVEIRSDITYPSDTPTK